MINYEGRVFRSVSNTDGGDVSDETLFRYRQVADSVWATYAGGSVRLGTLVAKVGEDGCLDMRYQHIGIDGMFKSGRCRSRPELLADGRLRIHEEWRWTDGASGSGSSVIEEVAE